MSDYVLMPKTPTDEMVSEAVYNTNRKYSKNPVDDLIAREVYVAARSARLIQSIENDPNLVERIVEVLIETQSLDPQFRKRDKLTAQAKAIIKELAR